MPSQTTPSAIAVDVDSESDLTPLTDTDFSDSDDSDFEIVSRPPKKRRITNLKEKKKGVVRALPRKRRGYKGALQDIWALPLDVTYEIFGHLKPLDLLQLSRTSKSLRRVLLRRSSTSVWMKARANVDRLPDCPFDLSEPAYASLVFETHCHYCYGTNVQTVIWEARLRCCKRCGTVVYTHWVNLLNEKVPDVLQCIIPSTHEFTTGTVHPYTEKKYSIEHAARLTDEMNDLTEGEKPMWFWNKKNEYERICEHSQLCRDFTIGRHIRRGQELHEARLRRANAIVQRLAAAGWTDEISKMSPHLLAEHKHIKIPKDLTERAWQKIEQDMTSFMEGVRTRRLTEERNKAFSTRCNLMKEMFATFVASQPLHSILPGIADFATMPEFKAVLENTDVDAPVTSADFAVGNDVLLRFCERWREEKDAALLKILRQSSLGASASTEMLSRATTLFNCKTCNVPISYPRILVHTCNYTCNVEITDSSNIFVRLRAEPWNTGGDRISFHEAAHKRAKYLLKALTLDPETSTETMNELNPFVECFCAICYRPGAIRTFARWNRMIEHTPRYTSAHVSRPYGIVDTRKTSLIKKLETLELSKLRRDHDWDDYSHRSYCCMVCKARETRQNTEKHLIHKHSKPNPTFGTDYTYHVDAKLRLRAPFVNLKITVKPAKLVEATTTSTSIPVQGDFSTPISITPSSSLDGVVPQQAEVSSSSEPSDLVPTTSTPNSEDGSSSAALNTNFNDAESGTPDAPADSRGASSSSALAPIPT